MMELAALSCGLKIKRGMQDSGAIPIEFLENGIEGKGGQIS